MTRTVIFDGVSVPQTFRTLVQDQVGHIDGFESLFEQPTGDLPSDRWAAITREQRLLNPHIILADVLADPSRATEAGVEDYQGRAHDLLEIDDPVAPIVLWVDAQTDRLSRLTTMEHDPLRRDVTVEVTYEDWDSGTAILFPAHVELRLAGQVLHSEQRDSVMVNGELPADTFDFPPRAAPVHVEADAERGAHRHQWHRGFASIGIPMSGVQSAIEATELHDGVHHLAGGSHHSLVVEQAGGVVVIDAPLYDARCVAILDWIEQSLGGAPTTHIVISHFHSDHSACARTFIARGATLVIGEDARDAWDAILTAPSTLRPDELSRNPVDDPPIMVVPDGGALTLDDPEHPVVLYDLRSEHAEDLLLPFVPDAGVLFSVDLFSPNLALPADNPQEVVDSLALHGITNDVSIVVGGHGAGTAAVADIVAAAAG
ncbi:MAG: hypothetical protein AAGF11_14940 [Myxococcota bacterium]